MKRIAGTRWILWLMSLMLAACRPDPGEPAIEPMGPASTVIMIHVAGLAPLLIPAMEQLGAIPHIRELRETGTSGVLNGGVPVAFAGTTTCLLTGKDTKLGGVDFWFFREEEKKILHGFESGHIRVKTVPQMLAMRGLPALTVFWPVTHPALPDAGEIISPGPIPDRQTIGDYAFVPDLTPGLPGRCAPDALRLKVDPILADLASDQEILHRFFAQGLPEDPSVIALKQELIDAFRADRAAMAITESLWKDEHRFVAVHLVGPDLLGRRLYAHFDPKHFQIGEEGFRQAGRLLVDYYRFVDDFVGRVKQRVGDQGAIILVSDHGIGPANAVDPDRNRMPGRAHPAGLCILAGARVRIGLTGERFLPHHLAPLILDLLGQPLARDFPPHMNDRILVSEGSLAGSVPLLSTYEQGAPNPSPSRPFGISIEDRERYVLFEEPAPPMAR